MRRIGILVEGRDAPGINAAIRAVTKQAFSFSYEVLGIYDGFEGLIGNNLEIFTTKSVSGVLPLGGSILGISRTSISKIKENISIIKENFEKNGITTLIVIGEKESFEILDFLKEHNIPSVGIPKTIDNDVYGSDFSIGFDSAVTTISEALDKLHTTASAHHRVMIVEVMGKKSGWLALYGGLAGGADYILIPEISYDLNKIVDHINTRKENGKDFSIIVVAEGIHVDGVSYEGAEKPIAGYLISKKLEELMKIKPRVTVLGHLQRGGGPTVFDRILATRLGIEAVKAAHDGKIYNIVGITKDEIVLTSINEAYQKEHKPDVNLFDLASVFF